MGQGKKGLINKAGKFVVNPHLNSIFSSSDGYLVVNHGAPGAKWGYIDKNGKPLTDFIYSIAGDVSEGLAAVWTQSGKWGYLRF